MEGLMQKAENLSIIENKNTNNIHKSNLLYEKHFEYLLGLDNTKDKDAIGFYTNEYLRMAALYWGISALNVLGKIDAHNKEETIKLILACWHENGGFGGSIGHDANMTSTHYAILILLQFNRVDLINIQVFFSTTGVGGMTLR